MAAESNTGFPGSFGGYGLNRLAISFQSGTCTSEMIPMGSYFGMNANSNSSSSCCSSSTVAGMMLGGNSSMINTSPRGMVQVQQAGNSSSLLLDSVPGLKQHDDTGLAVEWSVEEQYKLKEGLHKFADEPSIMRYIKIAATLRDKTVRDVALRCRWMTRKRRKAEEYNVGKKVNNRKDKLLESSSKTSMTSALPQSMAAYSLMMHMDQSEAMPFEGISGTVRHLLDQNAQAFSQITANLSTFKLQDNIDLFCCTRDNITAILNDMREMPGIMSQMPPLPVSINEDLANSILPNTTQSMIFGLPTGIQLKQEPRC